MGRTAYLAGHWPLCARGVLVGVAQLGYSGQPVERGVTAVLSV
ncbi:hypothetical protein [Plantactinospora sp. DSM 117369]